MQLDILMILWIRATIYEFGDIMGVSNILATPSHIRMGHQISYG